MRLRYRGSQTPTRLNIFACGFARINTLSIPVPEKWGLAAYIAGDKYCQPVRRLLPLEDVSKAEGYLSEKAAFTLL